MPEYIILKPICLLCQKEIDTPAETDMELFRFGLCLHILCLEGFDRVAKLIRASDMVEVNGE